MHCPSAVKVLESRLDTLPYTDEKGQLELVGLMQFHHDSPGLRVLRHKIASALVDLLVKDEAAMAELHKLHLKQRRNAKRATVS